jgi:hypothetical protein
VIELPVKISLTSEGTEWFIRNKRQLQRLRLADNRLEYGISLNNFTAASLQKMINIDYIAGVELARVEFASKRQEIIDLTKLIVYRVLYRRFDAEAYTVFLASPLIRRWNRNHPSRIIDRSSTFNPAQLENLLASVAPDLPGVSQDIQDGIPEEIEADPRLGAEEKRILHFLRDRFLTSMQGIMWCVLARSRGQPEYGPLIMQLRALVRDYMDRSRIAEYLALAVTELLSYTEILHSIEIARQLNPERPVSASMLRNRELREALWRHMQEQEDYLYLDYQISGKGTSIGTENRLRLVLFNRAREYQKLKAQVEDKLGLDIKEKSLIEFYRRLPEDEVSSELGLYYLSYLRGECAKRGVYLESRVSEIAASGLTVISLTLQF